MESFNKPYKHLNCILYFLNVIQNAIYFKKTLKVVVMVKSIIAVIALIVIYFVFVKSDFPLYVVINGETLGPRKDTQSNQYWGMYEYAGIVDQDYHYVVLTKPITDELSMEDFLTLLIDYHSKNGIQFINSGTQYIGKKQNAIWYVSIDDILGVIVIYVLPVDKGYPETFEQAGSIFTAIQGIQYKKSRE